MSEKQLRHAELLAASLEEEGQANAAKAVRALIEERAELLAACEQIEEWLAGKGEENWTEQDKVALGIVRAAIALATASHAPAEGQMSG